MKRLIASGLFPLCLLLVASQVRADWGDGDISDIIQNVKDVKNKVLTGDIPESAKDLKRQLDILKSQGVFITETVPELLEWLTQRRTPLLDFLETPGGGHSCADGAGSACATFRARLRNFAQDFAALRAQAPVVERLGLGDGGFGAGLVDHAPGFVLFGLHEILDRIPDWEYVPGDLADILDDIGDVDAFSTDWREGSAARAASPVALSRVAATAATPQTDTFCTNKASRVSNPVDPVRYSRIKLTFTILKNIVTAAADYMPDQLGADILGEGVCCAKFPFGPALKTTGIVIDTIFNAIDGFRANLEICRGRLRDADQRLREIENHLSVCANVVEYKKESGNNEAYDFVNAKITEAEDAAMNVITSRTHLTSAETFRTQAKWTDAYASLCRAYQNIGGNVSLVGVGGGRLGSGR